MKPEPLRKFRLGQLLTTANASARLSEDDIWTAIRRHEAGDWGDVDAEHRQANEHALTARLRLFSVYHSASGLEFWVITEAHRCATTVMLPGED
jgi:hypothetical protein